MRNVLVKDLLREIRKSKGRYLSILAIVAIGCGFFAGLKSSCPDMKLSAQKYFEDTNLADLRLVSTLGFNDDDVASVKNLLDARGVMPAYSVDAFLNSDEVSNLTVKILSYDPNVEPDDDNYINRPLLVSGRLPENSGECALEETSAYGENIDIGSTVSVFLKSSDISDSLKITEFKVVGFIESSSYISFEHGTTLIGDGKLDSYLYINKDDFTSDVYTDVYVTLSAAQGLSPFEDEYKDIVSAQSDELDSVADTQAQLSYDRRFSAVSEELEEAKAKLADAEDELNKELKEGKKQLDDAQKQINDGKAEYEEGLNTYNAEIADAESEIALNKAKLLDAQAQYESGLAQYNKGLEEFSAQKQAALAQISEYEAQLSEIREQIAENEPEIRLAWEINAAAEAITAKYENLTIPSEEIPTEELQTIAQFDYLISNTQDDPETIAPQSISELFMQYITTDNPQIKAELKYALTLYTDAATSNLSEQSAAIEAAKVAETQLESGIESAYAELEAAENTLSQTKAELDIAKEEIESGEAALSEAEDLLQTEKVKGLQELNEAERQLNDAQAEYQSAYEEYLQGKREAEEELASARDEIQESEKLIDDIPEPVWYILDRGQNPGYSGYQEDAEKVDSISAVFPFFFVLVAALVCSTTMSRMVDEQRIQMGTLKALGYSSGRVIAKYIIYAISASIMGSILGLSIGFQLFPKVIINAYSAMYRFPAPLTPFRWNYAIACTLVGMLCTGVTAFCVSYRALKIVPAQLMRPRAPKIGKRIMLEHIRFIWRRLSFSFKVTFRNIGRYKKRSLMTIIGIAGCTALILTGFGLRYAIGVIADRQFVNVFIADATVITSDKVDDFDALHNEVNGVEGVKSSIAAVYKAVDVSGGERTVSANLIVPQENDSFSDYIVLKNYSSGQPIILDESGVVINEKLAKLLGVYAGGTLTVDISDGRTVEVTVADVNENYALNYVYMTPELYREIYNLDEVEYNCFFLNKQEEAESNAVSEKLLQNSDILGVSFTEDTASSFLDTVKTLNSIVWLIIISAGALAFIVMYNLININVNERRNELATIKVLGFYDKEVSAYIYRENNISVAIGIVLGLVLGVFLERFVVSTAEVDVVMFASDMNPFCYIMAALITVFFAAVVTFVLHFQLKKISMVESMKAIE